ncbi:class I SAM-dependent methyltransferase [Tardiphaga sp. vice352]|uniref:class I SAM-dependent methyltransferase n=1 Tax=Tardiphaga sp. vice352 TaxID=2592816 RepID=UPI001164731D|nr:class I SAM-dependent methyltransferase [Tardiphaga sp. vice352]QDM33327.1 class I SAM-dependent methyltransferase [Tardiphaga sp. vice352]
MTEYQGTFTGSPDRLTDRPYWLGHIPFVMWLIGEVQPKVVVELGTETGVSLGAMCQAVNGLKLPTKIYGVDSWDGDINTGAYDASVYEDLTSYLETKNYGFVELVRSTFDSAVSRFADGSIDILHIDGCHTYDAVKHDFEVWRAKLSNRGVIMFHDTAVFRENFGVGRFWGEIASLFPSFEFSHSNGLGVLLIGPDQPLSLLRLSEAEGRQGVTLAPKAVMSIFEALGQCIIKGEEAERKAIVKCEEAERKAILKGEEADRKVREYEEGYVAIQASLTSVHALLAAETKKASHALALLKVERDLLTAEADRQVAMLKSFELERAALKTSIEVAQEQRLKILSSTSWRITAPLRTARPFLGRSLRLLRHVVKR